MEEMNIAFSYASYSLIDENGNELNREVSAPKSVDYHYLVGNTIIGCLTVMIDREKFHMSKCLVYSRRYSVMAELIT